MGRKCVLVADGRSLPSGLSDRNLSARKSFLPNPNLNPNQVVVLPKPNQVVVLAKPNQVVLPKPNPVVVLHKPNQVVVLHKPNCD